MRALLFVDLLGVKARWLSQGREGAVWAFDAFREHLSESLASVPAKDVLDGLVESDSAALICRSPKVAIGLASHLYLRLFMVNSISEKKRLWLRGVIAPHRGGTALRSTVAFAAHSGVQDFSHSGPLLDAIAAEKSGVKGMRLLIAKSLANKSLLKSVALQFDGFTLSPIQQLSYSSHPPRVFENYMDALWMATEDDKEWDKRRRVMGTRLRRSAKLPEEFIQAAATQVVFHEWGALLGKARSDAAKVVAKVTLGKK